MSDTEMIDFLRNAKLLRGISTDEAKLVFRYGKLVTLKKDDILIKEGQHDHPLYIIVKGQVEVILPKKADGKERPTQIKLNRLSRGDCLGEYALIDSEPASASVVAVEEVEAFVIERRDFSRIIESGDSLAKHVYRNMLYIMTKRARDNNKELDIYYDKF